MVASDVGGLPEVVEHGVTGFLAPVGDVDAMAGYCLKILADCDTAAEYAGTRAQARGGEVRLQADHPEYEKIYERLLAGSPGLNGVAAPVPSLR